MKNTAMQNISFTSWYDLKMTILALLSVVSICKQENKSLCIQIKSEPVLMQYVPRFD